MHAKMHRERVKLALEMMQRIPAENFDLSSWQDIEGNNFCLKEEEVHNCGSTACFAGYLVMQEDYQKWHGGQQYYDLVEADGAPKQPEWLPTLRKGQYFPPEVVLGAYFHLPPAFIAGLIYKHDFYEPHGDEQEEVIKVLQALLVDEVATLTWHREWRNRDNFKRFARFFHEEIAPKLAS